MGNEVLILIAEAMVVYFVVLWAHSLRHRFGPVHFFALIGGLTAIMSWVTDAGVAVEFAGITFVVGSTVFYTSLLLGVFVVYVFDGPSATRIAISTVVAVSAMVPIIATVLHLQMNLIGNSSMSYVPLPSLRINVASILTTLFDFVFLAISWEFLGKRSLRLPLWARAYLTLLGVMWLDVVLFATGAFLGSENYTSIMLGTLVSRLLISLFAFPFLYVYIRWQSNQVGASIENRPVLSILKQVADIELRLFDAQAEIERRKKAEGERDIVILELKTALTEVKTLRGFLPICSYCKKIRDDQGYWTRIEQYIRTHSDAEFTHSLCPDCAKDHYPELYDGDED
jgi:uncharacterized PurR-regulated membrane protein YhhQ (DUF165 family)